MSDDASPTADDRPDLYLETVRSSRSRSASRFRLLIRDAVGLAWRNGGPELRVLLAAQVLLALAAAAQLLLARHALTLVLRDSSQADDALPFFILIALVTAFAAGGAALQAQRTQVVGELVARATWRRILAVTTTAPLESFDSPDFYNRLQRVQSSALTQPVVVVQGLLGIAGGLIGTVGIAVALLAVQPVLLPLLLLAGIPLFFLQRRGGQLEFAFSLEQTPNLRRRYVLLEVLTGRAAAKEVRAYDVAPELSARHDALYDDYLVALRRKTSQRLRVQLLASAFSAVVAAVAVGVLLELVSHGHVSVASAGAAATGIALLVSKLEQLTAGAGSLFQAGLFLEDLAAFLAHAPEPAMDAVPGDQASVTPADPFEQLVLTDVAYTYPASSTPALTGINLTVPRGAVVALVGANGSGKTTLSKLLASLMMPSEGIIAWDGSTCEELPLRRRRASTAVLFQDFVHYELSLRDNVALGRASRAAAERELEAAIEAAGARGVRESLPEGLDTLLSPRFPGGHDLSGGQWQRVALARALFRDAPFVILDEPTAALDARAEAALFDAIRSLMGGRTVILVSHRFSSVRRADEIVVLEGGRIVEQGDHDRLMARDGVYAEMFTLQAEAFGLTPPPS